MATRQASKVVQHIRRVALLHDGAGLTDGQLLGCFIERQDEAAFAALVHRHGSMVWGVCHRLLNHHDAEDAFQATFLVLVRKAVAIVPREKVANWLYGVAHQTALQARRTSMRRRSRERQVTEMPDSGAAEQDVWQDLQPLLDQELSRLPDKYRITIVLCDLEGKTRKVAARQIGCPEGTVAGRLARARAMLAKRLARHGPAVSGASLAVALSQSAASAEVPTSAVFATIKAASLLAAGGSAAGVVSVNVVALTEGVLKTMLLTKLKTATTVALMIAILSTGVGLTFHTRAADLPPLPKEAAPPRPKMTVAAEPTVHDLNTALGLSWWQIDLPKGTETIEVGFLEEGRFTLLQRFNIAGNAGVPGPLKVVYQADDGSDEYRLSFLLKESTIRMGKHKKPTDETETNTQGRAVIRVVKNEEFFELVSFRKPTDTKWKHALVIKLVGNAD